MNLTTRASALPDEIPLCPATIDFGETIQCSIDAPAETDSYNFMANAGDRVLVRMIKISGTLWPGVIISRDGLKICWASDPMAAEIANCLLANSGIHTILAYDGFNTTLTGEYTIYLQRLNMPGNTIYLPSIYR